jgi:hypothetical protein
MSNYINNMNIQFECLVLLLLLRNHSMIHNFILHLTLCNLNLNVGNYFNSLLIKYNRSEKEIKNESYKICFILTAYLCFNYVWL